jgi:phosphatidylserine synthase
MNYNNYYVNNYGVAFFMFINIFILLEVCRPFKTNYDYITLIGIILMLITFNFSKWKVKNMKLIDADHKWIYLKTIALTILYAFSTCPLDGRRLKLLLVLYGPLLFPLNEYVIHRSILFGVGFLYSFCYDNPYFF